MALTTMYNGQVNSPQTALNGAINSSVTSITVVDGTILPTAPMPLVISEGTKEPETVLMTNKVGNVLTVTRAFQGVAQSWSDGVSIGRNFTAYDYNTLVENATTINNDLTTHKAESATQAHLAKNIGLEDTTGNFTATELEGAMSELFTNVSNGKGLIATAITDKGVPTSSGDTFAVMAGNIGDIASGSLWAIGESTSSYVISGLSFTPSYVYVFQSGSVEFRKTRIIVVKEPSLVYYINTNNSFIQGSDITINSDGFEVDSGMSRPYKWVAIE